MPPAPAAPDLDPIHPVVMVREELDAPLDCLCEAWPAALGIELVLREEDYVPTACAPVRSIILAAEQLACEWRVSPSASQDTVLLGRQFLPPFAIRLDYLGFVVQRRPPIMMLRRRLKGCLPCGNHLVTGQYSLNTSRLSGASGSSGTSKYWWDPIE